MRLILIALIILWPLGLLAQDTPQPPAVLVADRVFVTTDRQLVAQGNVEAFQGDVRLQAKEVRYDQTTGALEIVGPITLRDGEGVTILASAAELDADLRSGLLTGARLVLNQQLQLAAVQIDRVDGRYSRLYKSAVTSCKVCNDGRPPLWQIRAKQIIHDQQEKQIYFEEAQFLIRDVPILYIPRLRLPDPSLDRATGFLIPEIRTDSQLGTGFKFPYFIMFGAHRDLTLTPYIAADTNTLEFRYRQAFVSGRMEFEGAVSRDELSPGETRGYLFGAGTFDVERDFELTFTIETTTDEAYLFDYDYSDKDRLQSELRIARARRDEYIQFSLINFESLRDGESNATLPTIVAETIYEARYFPGRIGGELRLTANAHSHYRYSDLDIQGRDLNRLNVDVDWRRGWTLLGGLRAEAIAGADFDVFDVKQDSSVPDTLTQASPKAAVALRYPMVRDTAEGVTHFLEPMLQVGWTGGDRIGVPNDESTRVEFDEGNLLLLSRFPEVDRRERGLVTAYGVQWSRFDPDGWNTSLTVGQVFRDIADDDFTQSSGLTGTASDFLVAGQIKTGKRLALTARSLFSDNLDFTKTELRGDWTTPSARLGGSYLWLTADPQESRATSVSEITLDGAYRVDKHWTASADWRFDLAADRASTAGVGFSYENECVLIDISVNRRYRTSLSVEPSTSLGVSIGLRGFSMQRGTEGYDRACGSEAK
jgi:LPS-assembly protein